MQVDAYKCDRCKRDITRASKITLQSLTHDLRDPEPRGTLDFCAGCLQLLRHWIEHSAAGAPRLPERT